MFFQVCVWAGISKRGATDIVVFEGIMDAAFYQQILEGSLVPFIRHHYPEGHRLWQDNDPKHTAKTTQAFFVQHGINWFKTPAQSPVIILIFIAYIVLYYSSVKLKGVHFLRKNSARGFDKLKNSASVRYPFLRISLHTQNSYV